MWRVLITGIWLVVISVCDIRNKSVPVLLLGLGGLWTGGILLCQGIRGEINVLEQCEALIPGIALLVLAKLTEKAGCADGIVLMLLGLLEGAAGCLTLCFGSLLGASVLSGVLLVLKKVKKTTKLPFVPFLAIGWLLVNCGKWEVW